MTFENYVILTVYIWDLISSGRDPLWHSTGSTVLSILLMFSKPSHAMREINDKDYESINIIMLSCCILSM